jgi:hypothetical protein
MLKRRLADALVTTLNACAQLPGRLFYRYYLEYLNRRFNNRCFNDSGETTEAERERHIRFACQPAHALARGDVAQQGACNT